jgi:hypothetical protein
VWVVCNAGALIAPNVTITGSMIATIRIFPYLVSPTIDAIGSMYSLL